MNKTQHKSSHISNIHYTEETRPSKPNRIFVDIVNNLPDIHEDCQLHKQIHLFLLTVNRRFVSHVLQMASFLFYNQNNKLSGHKASLRWSQPIVIRPKWPRYRTCSNINIDIGLWTTTTRSPQANRIYIGFFVQRIRPFQSVSMPGKTTIMILNLISFSDKSLCNKQSHLHFVQNMIDEVKFSLCNRHVRMTTYAQVSQSQRGFLLLEEMRGTVNLLGILCIVERCCTNTCKIS